MSTPEETGQSFITSAQGQEETIRCIETMLDQARRGMLPNFAACLYLADGSQIQISGGESSEAIREALTLLLARIGNQH